MKDDSSLFTSSIFFWILIWVGIVSLILISFPKVFVGEEGCKGCISYFEWFCCCYLRQQEHDNDEQMMEERQRRKDEMIQKLERKLKQRIVEKITPYTKIVSSNHAGTSKSQRGFDATYHLQEEVNIMEDKNDEEDCEELPTTIGEDVLPLLKLTSIHNPSIVEADHCSVIGRFPIVLPFSSSSTPPSKINHDNILVPHHHDYHEKYAVVTRQNQIFHDGEKEHQQKDCFINTTTTECSICLGTIQPGDELSWSSGGGAGLEDSSSCCRHIFHQHCIVNWLTSLAIRPYYSIKQQEQQEASYYDDDIGNNNNQRSRGLLLLSSSRIPNHDVVSNYNNDDMDASLSQISMTCPICRQDFLK